MSSYVINVLWLLSRTSEAGRRRRGLSLPRPARPGRVRGCATCCAARGQGAAACSPAAALIPPQQSHGQPQAVGRAGATRGATSAGGAVAAADRHPPHPCAASREAGDHARPRRARARASWPRRRAVRHARALRAGGYGPGCTAPRPPRSNAGRAPCGAWSARVAWSSGRGRQAWPLAGRAASAARRAAPRARARRAGGAASRRAHRKQPKQSTGSCAPESLSLSAGMNMHLTESFCCTAVLG